MRRRNCGTFLPGILVMSISPTWIFPLLGRNSRVIMRSSVVFPAPDLPTTKENSPFPNVREILRLAHEPSGYCLVTLSKMITLPFTLDDASDVHKPPYFLRG